MGVVYQVPASLFFLIRHLALVPKGGAVQALPIPRF